MRSKTTHASNSGIYKINKNIPQLTIDQQPSIHNQYCHRSHQNNKISSSFVDYKAKALELMEKNTELQSCAKRSQNKIACLEQEIVKMNNIMLDMIALINNSGYTHQNCFRPQKIYNNRFSCSLQTHRQAANASNLEDKQYGGSMLTNILTSDGQHYESTDDKLNKQADSINNQYTTFNHYRGFNDILAQYKSIITEQHSKSTRIESNLRNKILQLENRAQKLQQSNINLQQRLSQSEKRAQKMNRQILQYQILTIKQQQLVERIQEFENELQSEEKKHASEICMLKQIQQDFQQTIKQLNDNKNLLNTEINNKSNIIEQLRTLNNSRQTQNSQILQQVKALQAQNKQILSQRNMLQEKYKQEIRHFEEMEDVVEKKLIQVEYQMNYYKKERNANIIKIKKLQKQCSEYEKQITEFKTPVFGGAQQEEIVYQQRTQARAEDEQQKRYYSFGEEPKSENKNSNEQQFESQLSVQESLMILKNQSNKQCPVSYEKKPEDEGEIRIHIHPPSRPSSSEQQLIKQDKISTNKAPYSHQKCLTFQQEESGQVANERNWQEECYQQSIKTLLQENQKLKRLFLNQLMRQQLTEQEIEQLELQFKILSSTLNQQKRSSSSL